MKDVLQHLHVLLVKIKNLVGFQIFSIYKKSKIYVFNINHKKKSISVDISDATKTVPIA